MLNVKREIRDIKRFKEIIDVLITHGFGYYLHKIDLKERLGFSKIRKEKVPSQKEKNQYPKKMRQSFEQLGGAFIKLGQLISLRPDLIPERYYEEFMKMQDEVPSFPYEEVKGIISSELKQPISKIFSEFEKEPIAAASIGQVHLARLKTGEQVVVKIQRPSIRQQMESDIDIFHFIARLIEKYINPQLINLTMVVREFEYYTQKELDYLNEAHNVENIRKNFKSGPIKIPKVYWDHTTSRILVLEYIKGKKLSQIKKISNRRIVSTNIANGIFKQIFEDGVFHADPHPGNIIVLPKGNIAFIDFGIVGYITESMREKVTNLFIAAVQKDISGMGEGMMSLGVVGRDVNREELNHDIINNFGGFYSMSLKEIKISDIFHRIITISKKHGIQLPKNFVLLSKCSITIESVLEQVDPEFNPVDNAKPFVQKLIAKRYNPTRLFKELRASSTKLARFITKVPDITEEVLDGIYKGDKAIKLVHDDVRVLTQELDRSSNRIANSMIITALIIASAFTYPLPQNKIFGIPFFPLIGLTFSGLLGLMLVGSILGEKRNI